MPLYMKMSENRNETTRHLKFRYISILTNLLRTLCLSVSLSLCLSLYNFHYYLSTCVEA